MYICFLLRSLKKIAKELKSGLDNEVNKRRDLEDDLDAEKARLSSNITQTVANTKARTFDFLRHLCRGKGKTPQAKREKGNCGYDI